MRNIIYDKVYDLITDLLNKDLTKEQTIDELIKLIVSLNKKRTIDMIKQEFIKKWAKWFPHSHYGELKPEMESDLNNVISEFLQPPISILLPDIRNKLSPMANLIAMLENGLVKGNIEMHDLVLKEIEQCKKNIEYLSGKEV